MVHLLVPGPQANAPLEVAELLACNVKDQNVLAFLLVDGDSLDPQLGGLVLHVHQVPVIELHLLKR